MPNVIIITIDDLNTAISPYSPSQGLITPNFERLKNMSVMFENAYANVPACSPSRSGLWLGVGAEDTGVYFNSQSWKDAIVPSNAKSLFGYFKSKGFETHGAGKLFHSFDKDLRASDWDENFFPDNFRDSYIDKATDIAASANNGFDFGPSANAAVADIAVKDYILDKINTGHFATGKKLMGWGVYRPHLPHSVGQQWFDLYPDPVTLPLGYWPGSTSHEGNIPDQADLSPAALASIDPDIGDKLTANNELDAYLRGYYASVSFADDLLGQFLDAVIANNVLDNTYIVVTTDHGYQLGEKRDFKKFELREISLKVPLFILGPGLTPRQVNHPVSLVDIYPTLCSLANLKVPSHCTGNTLCSTLFLGHKPQRQNVKSFYGNSNYMHRSVRTKNWRYIDFEDASGVSEELYCHDEDNSAYDQHEWYNVANQNPDVVSDMRSKLPSRNEMATPV